MVSPPDGGRNSVSAAAECQPLGGCRQSRRFHSRQKQNAQPAPPIFIHSSWRASHTWFWLKFREQPSTLSFYEPFHECLATLTRSQALSLGPNSWNSRHPAGEPYFSEFVPLLRKAGGVRLFVPEISYQWFLPAGGPTGDLHPEEIKYLALLIRHAERLRRIPVFGFTRSLGRLGAIKRQFPGMHIFQYRNLWTQWVSLVDHKQNGNQYFFQQILHIMGQAQDPYLSSIINRYVVRHLRSFGVERDNINLAGDNCYRLLATKLSKLMTGQDLFCLYMAFHIYLYICARQNADIVIDVTKMARDANYHQRVRDQLTSATGLPITFDDTTEVQQYYPFDPALIDWKEIRENVDFAVLMLDHAFDRQELLRFGAELVDETLAEIATSEKYVARARTEVARLTSERDSLTAARAALAAELDRIADERDAALAERDRLSQQHAAAMSGMDRLTGELAAAKAQAEALTAENARLRSELAAAIAAGEAEAATLATLRTELSQLATERDQLAAQGEQWFNAAVAWAADRLLSTPRFRQGRWFHRLMLRFRASPTGCWISRINRKHSPKTRANRARDAGEWELAARFYVDELNRNVYDPAVWDQLGHALKEAGKTSAAEIAYRQAAALTGKNH
jgi:hypothetical protein